MDKLSATEVTRRALEFSSIQKCIKPTLLSKLLIDQNLVVDCTDSERVNADAKLVADVGEITTKVVGRSFAYGL